MSQKQSSEKLPTQKPARSEKDYGLPRLTVTETARELRVRPEEITAWLGKLLHRKVIGWSQWSKWTNDTEPLSPAMIRLYLVQQIEGEEKWHAGFQALLHQREEMKRRTIARTAPVKVEKKRISGMR